MLRGVGVEREALLHAAGSIGLELAAPGLEAAGLQRLADLEHQVKVKMQVVDAGEHRAQHLAAAVEVVQVGPADGAGAGRSRPIPGLRAVRRTGRSAQSDRAGAAWASAQAEGRAGCGAAG